MSALFFAVLRRHLLRHGWEANAEDEQDAHKVAAATFEAAEPAAEAKTTDTVEGGRTMQCKERDIYS